jgi:hypothetical protein
MLPIVLSPRITRNVPRRDYVALNNGAEVAGPSCPRGKFTMTHAVRIPSIEIAFDILESELRDLEYIHNVERATRVGVINQERKGTYELDGGALLDHGAGPEMEWTYG